MDRHLFVGGPWHGQIKTLVQCATCEVPTPGGQVVYRRTEFTHSITHKQFVIFVHGNAGDWESWQVAQLLRQHGLL